MIRTLIEMIMNSIEGDPDEPAKPVSTGIPIEDILLIGLICGYLVVRCIL